MKRIAGFAVVALFLVLLVAPIAGGRVGADQVRRPIGGDPGGPSTTTVGNVETWFVELASPPVAETQDVDAARQLDRVKKEKDEFRRAARAAKIPFVERFAYDTLWNGLSIRIAQRHLLALSRLPEVVDLYPVGRIEAPEPATPIGAGATAPELFTAIGMTGVSAAHAAGFTGDGIRIAVMDTGVDYHHPDLGGGFGSGFKVAGGWDFVGNAYTGPGTQPVADPDPDDCAGHGTHVAGILAADGTVKGVAPGSTLRAYRVFGCQGVTEDDIMLAAMERILADGNQVLNMSIGAPFGWPQWPTARASKNLVNRGVVVVASAGNSGANGLYSMSVPGAGDKVLSSAAIDNRGLHSQAFRLDEGTLVGYQPMSNAGSIPTAGTVSIVNAGRGCNADLPLPSVSGRVALMVRGTCSFREKAINARNAGATAALIYNNAPGIFFGTVGTPPLTLPVAGLAREDGQEILSSLPTSLTWTADQFADPLWAAGGLVSSFSAFGPSPDLTLKPDIAAPGGLIFSTLPLEFGGYGILSGTSMASPHVAGAAALYLQAHPQTPSQVVRDLLQNSAVPVVWAGNPALGLIEATHRQGAGLLDIAAAIDATAKIVPGKISLGELEGAPANRTITLENNGAAEITYEVVHQPAIATGASTFRPEFFASFAGVGFSAPSITVPAGGMATVDLTVTEPADLPERGVFGGYIMFVPPAGARALRVPYSGMKGDYQSVRVLNPAANANGNPLLRPEPILGPNLPVTIDASLNPPRLAWILVHLDHQVRRLRLEAFDATNGAAVGRIGQFGYVERSRNADEFFVLAWDGTGKKGQDLPAGTYTLKLSIQKALAEEDNPAHWESWDSPVITIVRSPDSEPIP